jgi:hypothetical protein
MVAVPVVAVPAFATYRFFIQQRPMGGGHMATQPSLRVGDAEREAVAAELREHYAHGRLSAEEFNQRLDATFAAKTQHDLSQITADLPHARTYGGPLPASRTPGHRYRWSGDGSSRSGHRAYPGRHLAGLATLLAALASYLIVFDALAFFRFPFAGRLGLLVAIFSIIRGLFRRVFGSRHCRRR